MGHRARKPTLIAPAHILLLKILNSSSNVSQGFAAGAVREKTLGVGKAMCGFDWLFSYIGCLFRVLLTFREPINHSLDKKKNVDALQQSLKLFEQPRSML